MKTKKIGKGAVTGPKIAAGAVSASKVAGEVRQPRAYALFTNGSLQTAQSKGVVDVAYDAGNEKICFDLAFKSVTAMAVTQRGSGGTFPQVNVVNVSASCSAPHQDALVFTTNSAGAAAGGDFYAWFE